ncbi:MAG: 1-deoxy-D-xylulose-5-phosphate reductoisomerase [Nitrospiraceae bacterium]|nr:1-deoxy-D-xylulose-5-phosphate reductoisomerase [Nitrospiraceae bacterium]MSR25261.1 1-deoxy-D-xylulose-5-phosphate reductoisomerase [Nitrospiraceae bacterium]
MKRIIILGSTGSIGTSTLDIVSKFPNEFQVVGLTAATKGVPLEEQIRRFKPAKVALADPAAATRLRSRCKGLSVEILSGPEGVADVARMPEGELVISAIVGGAGLMPTLAAIRSDKHVALANKEPMVMAGQLMQEEAHKHGVRIFPVDSEHSAIFQSMEGHRREDIRRLILTASGGPLWNTPREQMREVKPEQALQHPNWKMGAKITIDSATMMNKGLEVVEARWLFDMPIAQIEVLVHRESVIHSMVEYKDGSVIAQLGLPDMRTPISYAMKYPARVPLELPPLDLASIGTLTFFKPDHDRFPCLQLGYDALKIGGTMPAVLNAANEIAVAAYLQEGIGFLDIAEIIRSTMDAHTLRQIRTLEDALEADRWAREKAGARVHALAH